MNLETKPDEGEKGLGMIFMPNKKDKIEECKNICNEEAEKLRVKKTFWRTVCLKFLNFHKLDHGQPLTHFYFVLTTMIITRKQMIKWGHLPV